MTEDLSAVETRGHEEGSLQASESPFISVVVPCRNERDAIGRFLDSVLRQAAGAWDYEILIADGMSDDGTREILAARAQTDARIHLIDNPGRIVSTGLNAAIRAARGEIVVRMDTHTEYAPSYIQECVEVLLETGAENAGGPPRVAPRNFKTALFAAAHHSRFAVGGAKSHATGYAGFVDSVFYGCWRKATLEKLGLFDENLVRNQDDELNFRLIQSGGKIWQDPRIVCFYEPRMTLRALFRQQFQFGFWKTAVICKHGRCAAWRHLVPGTFVLANVLAAAAALCGLALGARQLATVAFGAWASILGLYAAACLAAACVDSRPDRRMFPFLPPFYATYHTAYGTGFLTGALYWLFRPAGRPGGVFTNITR